MIKEFINCTQTVSIGKACQHKKGTYKTIKGIEFLICQECGFIEEVQASPCSMCKHCDFSKGFPSCNNHKIPTEQRLKSRNRFQLAIDLNCFRDCKYFELKLIKNSFWKTLFN